MFHENEVVMFILSTCILAFVIYNHLALQRFQHHTSLIYSFCFFTLGSFFTITEGFFFNDFFNLLEHTSYAVSSILIAIWSWKYFSTERQLD